MRIKEPNYNKSLNSSSIAKPKQQLLIIQLSDELTIFFKKITEKQNQNVKNK